VTSGRRTLQVYMHILGCTAPAVSRVGKNTHITYTYMYVGKTATATPWHDIAMEFEAVSLRSGLVLALLVHHHSPQEMTHLRPTEAGGPRQVIQIHIAVADHVHLHSHDDVVDPERRLDVHLVPKLHGHHHSNINGTSQAKAEAGEPLQEIHALANSVAGKIKLVPGFCRSVVRSCVRVVFVEWVRSITW